MRRKVAKVLVVGGSDASAGAGIQADLKTASALGAGYATTVVTAVTAQDTNGLRRAVPIDPSMVDAQLDAIADDIGADAMKTGMLANAAIVRSVCRFVDEARRTKALPLVVDPVLLSKGGRPLIDGEGRDALVDLLFPRATLITPNAHEAAVLADVRVEDIASMQRAAERLVERGALAVLVKGGHVEGLEVTDVLVTRDGGMRVFRGKRVETRGPRGTGCTLATAIATFLAREAPLATAILRARAYLLAAIEHELTIGGGHPVLNHAARASRGTPRLSRRR